MAGFVVILGSLDTKGREVEFLRERVLVEGGAPLVLDTGVLGEPSIPADISRHEVARAGGSSIEEIIRVGNKSHALVVMASGASHLLKELLEKGQLGGVLSIGGSRGAALGTQVMQTLPIGVPKLMVTTMASGQNQFGPYVGTRDIAMMHSVADIQGINTITRPVFINAAAAITAMSKQAAQIQLNNPHVMAASMLGATTVLVGKIQELVEADGGEVVSFHAIGTGGRALEELVAVEGIVKGVFDITPSEIVQELAQSPFSAGPDRLKNAGQRGIPQVIAPGGLDFIIEGPPSTLPLKYQGRKVMQHTPVIMLVRTSKDELAAVGRIIAERVSSSRGPVAAILPLRGFGPFSMEGQPLYEPESDRAFISAFKQNVSSKVQIVEMDTHINDPQVAEIAVKLMRSMLN
jgi:uncharacterized protein (UPF0261 family)